MTGRLPRYGQAFLLPNGSIAPVWYDYLRTLDASSLTDEIERQVQANTAAIKALQQAGFGNYLPASAYVLGINSVETFGDLADGTRVMLRGDVALPEPTTYYGVNQDQERGFHPVSDSVEAVAGELTKGVGDDGVTTFGLEDVTPAVGGTLQRYGFDAKGRRTQEAAADTDDLDEGSSNLYFTDERVDDRVQAANYSPAGAWNFQHNITVAGMTVGLGPGENVNNVAIGNGALESRTTGDRNVAIGSLALNANMVHGGNVAIGRQALWKTVAHNNVGIGYLSLSQTTSGQSNIGIGTSALQLNLTGVSNTAIGFRAGLTGVPANANVGGHRNTYIGYDSGPGSPAQLSDATAIGAEAIVTTSSTVVLGRTADTTVIGATGDDGSGAKLQVTGPIKSTSEYRVGANKVLGTRDTGWTPVAGTAQKGGGTTYTAPVISASPTQAEVQAMADALQDAHQKIKALQDALTAHGLIGS